jgi:DNA modification methylase
MSTLHRLINADARNLSFLADASVHLVVTSPPYWNLKRYNETLHQLGHIQDYEAFLAELEKVWREVFRVLVPGGCLVCVVGDVALPGATSGGISSFRSMRTSARKEVTKRSLGVRMPGIIKKEIASPPSQ